MLYKPDSGPVARCASKNLNTPDQAKVAEWSAMELQKIYWPTALFLTITPLITAVALPIYLYHHGVPVGLMVFTLVFAALTNLSITAGYHRLFAHKSYEAHPLVKFVFLLIGASAWQGSALKWSSDHRRHHAKVDSEDDPYAITRGFWHAHMGWLFLKETVDLPIQAPDLRREQLVYLQDKYYMPLAIATSFGFPTLVGLIFFNAPFAGLLVGGALRVILTQQSTFFVNSLSHTLGRKTYSDSISARDSILVAILTHGEGYHNFHHQFQTDYRNGIRWYHWDPTKWTIRMLALVGLARKLRRISEQEILRARLQMEEIRIRSKGYSQDKIEALRQKILAGSEAVRNLKKEIKQRNADLSEASRIRYRQLKSELILARAEFRMSLRLWKQLKA